MDRWGLKFRGISGDCKSFAVALSEVPMGTLMANLFMKMPAASPMEGSFGFCTFLVPSSGYLPCLRWLHCRWTGNAVAAAGSMVGSGAIVVCAEAGACWTWRFNATRFYRNESCGKCVPCRVGSQKKWSRCSRAGPPRQSSKDDMLVLGELSTAMKQASICGLRTGGSSPHRLR